MPGAWSILNAYLIVIKRPIHPGFHIALDVVLTIVLWFFGILGLIGFMAWKGTSVHETAIAVFALMIVLG